MANKRIPELDPVVTAAQTDKFIVRQSGDVEDKHSDMSVMQLALLITESQITDLQAYLTAEVNDLSAVVTWANIPDANVPESAVTQHVGAIDHDSLLNFLASEHFTQAAISITESQISDLGSYLENVVEDTTPQLGGDLDTDGNNVVNNHATVVGLDITAGTNAAADGGDLGLSAGDSGVGATGDGGDVNILAGASVATAGDGGAVSIKSGAGFFTGAGGDLLLEVGSGGAAGPGTSGNFFVNTTVGLTADGGLQVPIPGLTAIYGIGRSGEGVAGDLELWAGYAAGTGGASRGGDLLLFGGGQGGGAGVGGDAKLYGGESDTTPGNVEVEGGQATVSGSGGQAQIKGGDGFVAGTGGLVRVDGGAGAGASNGGQANLIGGPSGSGATGDGGNAEVVGGASAATNGDGGDVVLSSGAGAGSGDRGDIILQVGGTDIVYDEATDRLIQGAEIFAYQSELATGNVIKVGTPVDNQVGVWTGDGTIEGDANFTWDGSHLNLPLLDDAATPTLAFGDGDSGFYESVDDTLKVATAGVAKFFWVGSQFRSETSGGASILNELASATNPTLIPRNDSLATGIGSVSSDILNVIVNGTNCLEMRAIGGIIADFKGSLLLPQVNDAVTPTFAFGDGDSGFYEGADDQIHLATAGVSRGFFNSSAFTYAGIISGSLAASGAILNETASATNPTINPNKADADSGIGQNATGQVSLIGDGAELARAVAAASGGLLANNTATGAGLERVLTVSDLVTDTTQVANDAVQARRTTTLDLTTAFVDVTLDTTDIETDSAVLDHDLATNSDNIIIGEAGTYEISYQFDIDSVTGNNSIILAEGRVRLNDLGTGIAGSHAANTAQRNHGNVHPGRVTCKFIATLAATDFITLQVDKIDIDGTETYFIDETSLQVTRLL